MLPVRRSGRAVLTALYVPVVGWFLFVFSLGLVCALFGACL